MELHDPNWSADIDMDVDEPTGPVVVQLGPTEVRPPHRPASEL
jgi:hypothetical protein